MDKSAIKENIWTSSHAICFSCLVDKNSTPLSSSTEEKCTDLLKQLICTWLYSNQFIPRITSIPLKGKQTKSTSKSRPNIDNGHIRHTGEVVTEPLAGVSTTISPFILDILRPNLEAQSAAIKQCVAPVSIIAIKGVLLMKHVPMINRYSFTVWVPVRANTFPL